MGFFRKFANYARQSNDGWHDSYERDKYNERVKRNAREIAKNSVECCANCHWFEEGYQCHCYKHDFSFSLEDVDKQKIHYKRVCNEFRRKF